MTMGIITAMRFNILFAAEAAPTGSLPDLHRSRAVNRFASHAFIHKILQLFTSERNVMAMSVERTLFAFGGIMVMATSLLALFHHPYWTWFTLFIGFNCFQSSFTGFCPPAWLMKKFGLKSEAELAIGQT